MTLFDLRKEYGLSQLDAANICGVPLRTYVRYEGDNNYGSGLKRTAIVKALNDKCEITEEKGILSLDQITKGVRNIVETKYRDSVSMCYLFGSYAKGKAKDDSDICQNDIFTLFYYATDKSDVNLCVSTELKGLDFVGLAEDIHIKLHKKVDLIRLDNASTELIYEIMKGGLKIYG